MRKQVRKGDDCLMTIQEMNEQGYCVYNSEFAGEFVTLYFRKKEGAK